MAYPLYCSRLLQIENQGRWRWRWIKIPALYFLTMIPLAYFPPGASCWRGLASQASPQMPHLPPITSHWCWKITSFDQGSSINDVSLFFIHLTSPSSRFSDINLSYCRHKVFYPIIFRLWRHLWTTHYADCDSQKFHFWKIKTFGNQNHYALYSRVFQPVCRQMILSF